MDVEKLRVAVAATAHRGLKDVVSEVFGRANTFVIVDVEDGEIKEVDVLENPALVYRYGAGPIVVKMLVDKGVKMVIGAELGPGASALLEQHDVTHIMVKPGISVEETIRKALGQIKK